MNYKDATTCFITIYMCFLFKIVQICHGDSKVTPMETTTTAAVMTRVPPPLIFPFPGIKFEGVEYEDQMHVKHRYPHVPRESYYSRNEDWRCWYEQLRCIRYQSNNRPVCTSDVNRMIYSFISICEMEYYNCVLEITNRFYYSGDDRECWYIWDVHILNDENEFYQKEYRLPSDNTDTWPRLDRKKLYDEKHYVPWFWG